MQKGKMAILTSRVDTYQVTLELFFCGSYTHLRSSCSTCRIKRSSLAASSELRPRNGWGREVFEKYCVSLSEGTLVTKPFKRKELQSEIRPTKVRPRLTPGVDS